MNLTDPPHFQTTEFHLERIRELIEYRISQQDLAQLRFRIHDLHREVALQIEKQLYGERIVKEFPVEFQVKYPANWWQAFKLEHFPAWLLRRFPVRYHLERQTKIVDFTRVFAFPNAYVEKHPVLSIYHIRDQVHVRPY